MTQITLENIDSIKSITLMREAREALKRGEEVAYDTRRYRYNPSIDVETVVFNDVLRAGQAVNSDPVWGDWDPIRETLHTDDGIAVYLDGAEGV